MNGQRTGNGFGPNAISFQELRSWAEMTRRNPSAWEVETLRRLDQAWLQVGVDQRAMQKAKVNKP